MGRGQSLVGQHEEKLQLAVGTAIESVHGIDSRSDSPSSSTRIESALCLAL
jgi:hypothetical protein